MRRVGRGRDHEWLCSRRRAAAAAVESILLKAFTFPLALLFVADLLIWSHRAHVRVRSRAGERILRICYSSHIHEILRPFGRAYWGWEREEEEEGRQSPLTSAKRSFDIPALLPLHVALPLPEGKNIRVMQRNAARFLLPLRYCCVLLQSNGTSSECWKCQHGQRERGREGEGRACC